jgi:hypothetical protein
MDVFEGKQTWFLKRLLKLLNYEIHKIIYMSK